MSLCLSVSLFLAPSLFSLSVLSLPLSLSPSDSSSCSVRRCFLFVFPSSFLSLSLSLSLSPSLLSVSVWLCSSAICFLSLRLYVSLSLSLFLVLFLVLPCGHRRFVLCLSVRSILFSSLFASVTPSPCLLSLSLCVKRPAPLLFSSFLFLALAPCLPAFLSSSVPHCPSLSPLCFSLSLSLSLLLSLALSLSLSLSLSLFVSLFLVYSVCLLCWSVRLTVFLSF